MRRLPMYLSDARHDAFHFSVHLHLAECDVRNGCCYGAPAPIG